MARGVSWTGERTIPEQCTTVEEVAMYHRHLAAYHTAAEAINPTSEVIDVGCGTGYGTRLLANHGAPAIGVDIDGGTIEHATFRYGTPRCTFQVYDGRSLPFSDARFGSAVSFQVIEHVPDDDRFVAEARRVLRDGGVFLVTTPNRVLRLRAGERPWNRFHVREYGADQLAALFSRHFSSVDVMGITATPDIVAWEMERIAWAQRTVDRDPLGLRRLIPERVKPAVVRLLKSRRLSERAGSETARSFGADRYSTTKDPSAVWLDLLAICRA